VIGHSVIFDLKLSSTWFRCTIIHCPNAHSLIVRMTITIMEWKEAAVTSNLGTVHGEQQFTCSRSLITSWQVPDGLPHFRVLGSRYLPALDSTLLFGRCRYEFWSHYRLLCLASFVVFLSFSTRNVKYWG
jgi:hypothetical protein